MDLQQSSFYKKYVQSIGWIVITVDGINIYIKNIPLLGTLAKIQRPRLLPYLPKLIPFLKKYHVRKISFEPTANTDQQEYQKMQNSISKFFILNKEPFLPTKTIRISLIPSEETLFSSFTEAKRRAVRKAIKNNILIQKSTNIKDLIDIKAKSAGMFGSITTYGLDRLWSAFSPDNATILLAYHNTECHPERSEGSSPDVHRKTLMDSSPDLVGIRMTCEKNKHSLVGGVLLLFFDHTAYYWIAGATRQGKKLFAPTLLVWEALKISKKRGCTMFDFVGVFDERSPKQYLSWKGFTKFKEGFGGQEVYYPIAQ